MKIRSVLAVSSSIAIIAVTGFVTAPAASGADCRQSSFNSTDFFGNKRFDCPDGSYTLKKPFGTQSWDDPMSTYELRPNSGFNWNKQSQKCRYNSVFNRYNCR